MSHEEELYISSRLWRSIGTCGSVIGCSPTPGRETPSSVAGLGELNLSALFTSADGAPRVNMTGGASAEKVMGAV